MNSARTTNSKMSKAQAIDALASAANELGAYQEAFFALARGEVAQPFTSGPLTVQTLGLHRACGGVVIIGASVMYADQWIANMDETASFGSHARIIADQIRRAQVEAFAAA